MLKLINNQNTAKGLYTSCISNGNILSCFETGLQAIGQRSNFTIVGTTLKESEIQYYLSNSMPVMICIPGHATVAFAYDSDKDVYYAHNGYTGSSRLISISPSEIVNAFVFYPSDSSEHNCSSNYTKASYGENYCPCFLDEHPHQSQHTYTYDSSTHTYLCGEKVISTGSHAAYTYTSISDSLHYVYCKCGYNLTQSHWYYYPKVIAASTTSHYLECVKCGRRWSEQHFAMYYTEESSTRYNVYCYCGVYMYYTTSKPSGLYLKT
jgi:hypothetical protein